MSEREFDADVIIVGGGLAGCSAAIVLANAGLSVIVIERGDYCGAKNMTGGRLYGHSLEKIIPNFKDEAPIERIIKHEKVSLMTADGSLDIGYGSAKLSSEPGNASYTVLRAKFDQWLAEKAEEAGAEIITGILVDNIIVEDGKVVGIESDGDEMYAEAIILADGVIGQMMEKVVLPAQKPRRTEAEVIEQCPWAATGKAKDRKPNIITSLELKPEAMEINNLRFQAKYREIEENEVRFEEINCEDAEYLIIAFGSMARIGQKAMELAREKGIKVGILRPITLWPFPTKAIAAYADKVKGMLVTELNAGQMIEDVRLAVNGKVKVEHFGRLGGIVPDPDEIVTALKEKIIK